jgi:DNA-binding transcriptional ArsR family regulator
MNDEWDDDEELTDRPEDFNRLLERLGLGELVKDHRLVRQALKIFNQPGTFKERLQRMDAFVSRYRRRPVRPISTPTKPPPRQGPKLSAVLEQLRIESRLTVEDLAEAIELQPRSVYRHLAGIAIPRPRHLAAYEWTFSKRLHREIHLPNVSKKSAKKSQ